MCTFNFSLNDALVDKIRPSFKDEASVQAWLQKQLENAILHFDVTMPATEAKQTLSQQLRGIAKTVPEDFDYKKELEQRI